MLQLKGDFGERSRAYSYLEAVAVATGWMIFTPQFPFVEYFPTLGFVAMISPMRAVRSNSLLPFLRYFCLAYSSFARENWRGGFDDKVECARKLTTRT